MTLTLTFQEVCTAIKKQGVGDPKLIDAVDKLLGLALICSSVVLDPAAAALLPTLAAKNEIIKISKGVFDKLAKRKDDDYLKRHETMRLAYGLLVFTAFFEALDMRIPDALRNEIDLLEGEKAFLVKDAVRDVSHKRPESGGSKPGEASVADVAIPFPHPTETLSEQTQRQARLWKQMGQGFKEFVQQLAFWETADEKKHIQLLSGVEKIGEEAARVYEAQYFELARKFEDFAIWASLHEHKTTKALIGELSEYVQQYAQLSSVSAEALDVGFARLHETVLSIPETVRLEQATELIESLDRHYQARVNEPIIDDRDEVIDDSSRLSFPRVRDAFVPQAFRVLRQGGKTQRLEDEATWSKLPRRNDLGAFLLSYLSSPYSTETPLLVLGLPGSGKSLLTTILSAQLMSKHFTVIRVPLREVNADADIVTQIEEGIRRITGFSVDSWIRLRILFKNSPPLVILDGYDELLQASGQVFSGYIKDAQRFQEREAEQGRPVRVLITSRVTLIDKATVPSGSTIIRLLEFDKTQRERWISIWNKSNAGYFRDAGIEEFVLPDEKEKGADKILALAEQPLLLLMLALYDSQDNQLRKSRNLDRTKLYDSLLRRFVTREREKEKEFKDAKQKERNRALSVEMQRLGVAALGMYNRRKVHILAAELDEDLAFFKLEREVAVRSGKSLTQADLLLGSFFFVHKSKAQHHAGAEETHEEVAAFEFLHNTFGEFLTADFILRRAVAQVNALRASEANEALRSVFEKMMSTADGFERDWFASLIFTPLFTRPVVMEMIREWAPHVFKEQSISQEDFVENLEKIILNQIMRLLNKREMPSIMRKETAQEGYRVPFGDLPLIGHMAIYSINLLLLRVLISSRPFVFDEDQVVSHEDGARPWSRLIHTWRSWFAMENLNGLTAVMLASRAGSKITIVARNKIQAEEARNRLHEFLNVAVSLGDDVASGLSGLLLFEPSKRSLSELNEVEQRLGSEKFDLGLAIAIKRLQLQGLDRNGSLNDFMLTGQSTIELALRTGMPYELEHVCFLVARSIEQALRSTNSSHQVIRDSLSVIKAGLVVEVALQDASSGLILWKVLKDVVEIGWRNEFSDRFVDHFMRMSTVSSQLEYDGQIFTNWLYLIRELRIDISLFFRDDYRHRLVSEFFERTLDPDRLQYLSERSPETALAYLQLIRELGGAQFIGQIIEQHIEPRMMQKLIERMLDLDRLLYLSERSPQTALAYLQLIRELGGAKSIGQYIKPRMMQELIERMLNLNHLMYLSERSPETALAYLQLIRELGGAQFIGQYIEPRMMQELIERMLDPRRLLYLSERSPETPLAYLQLIRELGRAKSIGQYIKPRMMQELIERMLDPRRLLYLSERSPETALDYIQIISEFGDSQFVAYAEREEMQRFFDLNLGELDSVFQRKPSAATFWLTFTRMVNTPSAIDSMSRIMSAFLLRQNGSSSGLGSLPISVLSDLRWLAYESGNGDLTAALSNLTV